MELIGARRPLKTQTYESRVWSLAINKFNLYLSISLLWLVFSVLDIVLDSKHSRTTSAKWSFCRGSPLKLFDNHLTRVTRLKDFTISDKMIDELNILTNPKLRTTRVYYLELHRTTFV